ncbi:MAG: EcsC family protein [Alphaproteobacteria bacterium]|nr:EcsC family protein [Alphaproteobacteria bacterium]MBU2270081.1 EcsC family protein [Alphaproteobacteria bacterium]MBU2417176.1 EcsC family protein [Alphaproteobacteria bacterium]
MANPSEIVSVEDTPGGLITVVDDTTVRAEVAAWRARVLKRPGLWDKATRGTQERINRMIPERVHAIITAGVEAMTQGILVGSDLLKAKPRPEGSLAARELRARAAIKVYRNTASVEGGVAGAGGFVLAAADFPALMAIKVRMLGDIVAAYGWGGGPDGDSGRERLFVLHIFHLAFASAKRRPEALAELERWIAGVDQPTAVTDYDWRKFQIEYRDYIDLAKMAQLIPVVGAPIGAVVNWRLVDRLGETAMMACRMRWLAESA